MNKLLLFTAGLLACALQAPAGPRPPVRPWRGFHGPAYLPGLTRRPSQHHLDSLASAARVRKANLAAR
jgi:hypothetical protein